MMRKRSYEKGCKTVFYGVAVAANVPTIKPLERLKKTRLLPPIDPVCMEVNIGLHPLSAQRVMRVSMKGGRERSMPGRSAKRTSDRTRNKYRYSAYRIL